MGKTNTTYIGDKFIINVPITDEDVPKSLNGEIGTLVGFVKKTKYVLEHETSALTPSAGVYTCLGNAVLRLDNGRIIKTDLMNLEPIGYTFDDCNEKNFNYMREVVKHSYLGPLPYVPYTYGDTVLVAKHGRLEDDVIGTVVDTVFKGPQVFYIIDLPNDSIEVAKEKIIDVLELGDFSEQKRYLKQMQTFERIVNRHMRGFKHLDEENEIDNPWMEE